MRYVYLHGFGSSPETSKKIAWLRSLLAQIGVELEAPDLVPGEFSKITLSGQVRVLEDFLGGDPCRIVGSSMGGLVASNYALTHPEVESMVLLAPAFGFPRRWVQGLGELGLKNWQTTGWLTVYHHAAGREEDIHYEFYEDALKHQPEPAFTQPATIVHGVDDETVPVDYSRSFVNEHNHVSLVEVDSGHSLDSEEAHEAIWAASRNQFGLSSTTAQ